MAVTLGRRNLTIPTQGLKIHLDAGDTASYPGSGTNWYDLSGNNNNFTINASAYNSSGPKYMDFNGSYSCAKAVTEVQLGVNNVPTDVTVVCWTRMKNSSADWRTLMRGSSLGADHQVMGQSGGWAIGVYDNNNGTAFTSSGVLQTSLPNYGTTNWVMLAWRFSGSVSPYYTLTWNDTPDTVRGTITSPNAGFKTGIYSIGAEQSGTSQFWGDIGMIAIYDRVLTSAELLQCYNAGAPRFMGAAQLYEDIITHADGTVSRYTNTDPVVNVNTGKLINVSTYTGAGTYTWTKPPNCTRILVKVVGGGGGGAGHCESGGAGGYSEKLIDATTLSSVTVTVGAGGASNGYYAAAADGTTSSFGSYCSASGGYGANRHANHTGGHGGIGSGGDLNLLGGSGTGHGNAGTQQCLGVGGVSYWGSGTATSHNDNNPNNVYYVGAPGAGGPGGNQTYKYVPGNAGMVVVYAYY